MRIQACHIVKVGSAELTELIVKKSMIEMDFSLYNSFKKINENGGNYKEIKNPFMVFMDFGECDGKHLYIPYKFANDSNICGFTSFEDATDMLSELMAFQPYMNRVMVTVEYAVLNKIKTVEVFADFFTAFRSIMKAPLDPEGNQFVVPKFIFSFNNLRELVVHFDAHRFTVFTPEYNSLHPDGSDSMCEEK